MMRPDDLAWSDVGAWPSTGDTSTSLPTTHTPPTVTMEEKMHEEKSMKEQTMDPTPDATELRRRLVQAITGAIEDAVTEHRRLHPSSGWRLSERAGVPPLATCIAEQLDAIIADLLVRTEGTVLVSFPSRLLLRVQRLDRD